MHPRYPAPAASKIWSTKERLKRLRAVTDVYTTDAIRRGVPFTPDHSDGLIMALGGADEIEIADFITMEQKYGHEIVGFIDCYLDRLPEEIYPFVHYGLTSSDLVEYDLFRACYTHAQDLTYAARGLVRDIDNLAAEHSGRLRAGRTHGQIAELTTLSHQLGVQSEAIYRISKQMSKFTAWPVKSPGPTGNSDIRLPVFKSVLSTQIIPRDYLLEWAVMYLRLSNALESLAMFVRLGCRSEVGEFSEGNAENRQGSSAMPGKKNPIDSEKVCGLARVVRGQFVAISEISALWEDRDLSNSSTERISVPEIAATVEHMTLTMTKVIQNLVVHEDRIAENANDPRTRANAIQSRIMKERRVGPIEASRIATEESQIQ